MQHHNLNHNVQHHNVQHHNTQQHKPVQHNAVHNSWFGNHGQSVQSNNQLQSWMGGN